MRRLLVLFFLFIFFAGCTSRTPEGVLSAEKMTKVLIDMHLADGYTMNLADTPKIVEVYRSVFKTYNIDSASFRKSLDYYSKNPEKLQAIYAKVTSTLKEMEKEEQKKEEIRFKEQQKREKKTADSLKRVEKLRRDSIRRDSLKRSLSKKTLLNKDSLRRDSIKKAGLKKKRNK